MADHYEYTGISEKAKHFAIAQLHENPLKVNDHIEKFRQWVESIPHLVCPKDSKFLLRFLRVAKFDQKRAQERLDNFCTTRGDHEWFPYPKRNDPRVSEYLKKPIGLPVGRTNAGEMIVLIRSNAWDPDTMTFQMYMTLILMTLDILVEEEETQIYGIIFIIDTSDLSRKAMAGITNRKIMKTLNHIWHESYPMRLKREVFYNEPELHERCLNMHKHYMIPRMKKRIYQTAKDLETLFEKIPGVEKILPTEYGGEGGPMSEMAERAKKQFLEYYKNGDPLAGVYVDESKRPGGESYLSDYDDYDGPIVEDE